MIMPISIVFIYSLNWIRSCPENNLWAHLSDNVVTLKLIKITDSDWNVKSSVALLSCKVCEISLEQTPRKSQYESFYHVRKHSYLLSVFAQVMKGTLGRIMSVCSHTNHTKFELDQIRTYWEIQLAVYFSSICVTSKLGQGQKFLPQAAKQMDKHSTF